MNKYDNEQTTIILKQIEKLKKQRKKEIDEATTAIKAKYKASIENLQKSRTKALYKEFYKANYKAENTTEQTKSFVMFGKQYTELNAAEKREYNRIKTAEWRKSQKAKKMEAKKGVKWVKSKKHKNKYNYFYVLQEYDFFAYFHWKDLFMGEHYLEVERKMHNLAYRNKWSHYRIIKRRILKEWW